MNKLIIVCGLPASGKTCLASELSKKTKIVCLSKDSIKEKLFEGLGLSTLQDSKSIGKPSIDVMFCLAEQQIINGIDIILESPFNFPEDYSIFKEWENKYGVEIYSIICHINTKERKRRFINRLRHQAHHDDVRIRNHFPEEEYDYKKIPGKQIRVETNQPIEILVNDIYAQLR